MKIKPFRLIYPNFDFVASPDSFFEDAKNTFVESQKNGFYQKIPVPGFFIYQIEANKRTHTGLIAMDDVHDFFDGKIKKHENTLSEKEQQQMQLFLRWNAILKPILLTYETVGSINDFLLQFTKKNPPLFATRFEKDGQAHRAWAIQNPADIAHLQQLFAAHVESTYIADGHHRTTTVALLHERLKDKSPEMDFDNLFCAFFSADQLDILDYNRVVEGLKDISITHFMVKMSKIFDLEVLVKAEKPREKHEITMCFRKEWFRLRWKPEVLERFEKQHVTLDATLLNELVFSAIFGIHDVRTDTRITYVEGAKGLEGVRKAANNNRRIGFVLYPVHFADLMYMADDGESLPPKSTYFEPRMRTGMMVKSLLRED